ncbi:MAG: dihydroorotate dehydrogenase electron transfer subunit [Actinomycetales bacterium]|nr:dihydroorotate dehydrogenase electron transfer subunit [Actinomycetales bacterium]
MSAPTLHRRAGEVVANRPLGAYRQLSVVLPALATPARPGQFVIVPPARADHVLPRTWWVAGERTEAGFGTTLELVVPGTGALPAPGEELQLTGPVGRGFGLPTTPVTAVVAAQGAAGAAARWLCELLRSVGCTVHLVSCADEPEQHVDLVLARRSADGVVLTELGSAAATLADLTHTLTPSVLYAAGPLSLSRTVALVAERAGAVSQVSGVGIGAEGLCGHGLCGACDLPLRATAGRGATVRPCADGPVLRGAVVDWAAVVDGDSVVAGDAVVEMGES